MSSDSGIPGYAALALQVTCQAINKCPDTSAARASISASIERTASQVAASKQFIGPHLRLVVLPEYFLTSYPLGETIASWRERGCLDPDGAEYAAIAKIAADNRVFLSGNVYETDPHFPELYFQASFIVSDTGELVHRYRRLISMFGATPHDVLDKYLDLYGPDSLFPVATTEIGRLATVASEEILYPEITRALGLRGAEVICHSSSEIAQANITPKNAAKLARAYENHAYIVSANSAGIDGIDLPKYSVDQGSKIIDYHGVVLAEAATGESMAGYADIHIDALREYRRRPGMFNTLTRQRLALFEAVYADGDVYPANTLLRADGSVIEPDRSHFLETQRAVIEKLIDKDLI